LATSILGEFTSAERLYLFPQLQAPDIQVDLSEVLSFQNFPLMGKIWKKLFPRRFANIAIKSPFPRKFDLIPAQKASNLFSF